MDMQVRGRAECWAQSLGTWYPDPSSWATARPLSRPATHPCPAPGIVAMGPVDFRQGRPAVGHADVPMCQQLKAGRSPLCLASRRGELCSRGPRWRAQASPGIRWSTSRASCWARGAPVQRFVMRRGSPRNASPAVGRKPREPCKPREYWPQECWRSRPESNWGRRICNPLPNHLATGP